MLFGNDPFADLLRLQRALERTGDRPFHGLEWSPSGRGLYPGLNFFETGDVLVCKAEMPGVDRESLNIEVEGNLLTLSGRREVRRGEDDRRYHRRERASGEFRRAFRLPFEVDTEKTSAAYGDGVLTVRLEKHEAAKPRQITVQG